MIHDFDSALVRLPGASAVHGLRTGGGEDPDHAGLVAEHAAYIRALGDAGVDVEILPPLEEFPDSVFVEDPAFVHGATAIKLRPGAASRAKEADLIEPVLRRRFAQVLALESGFADGGDLLMLPDDRPGGADRRHPRRRPPPENGMLTGR